jgi:CBS domain-containing protein
MAGDDIKRKGQVPVREAAGFEHAAGQQGRAEGRRMQVEDLMKRPAGCREGQTVRECAQVMMQENIGFTPICNAAGEPIGTITDRDLAIRVVAKGISADTKVEDVMTRDVVSCRVRSDLREAEQLMRDRRKSRLMVCDDDGKLAGVISLSDVAEVEDEATAGGIVRDVSSRETQQPSAS